MNRRDAMIAGSVAAIEWEFSEPVLRATVDGRHYELECRQIRPGVFWFAANGRSVEVAVLERDSSFLVSLGGHQIPVEFVDPRKALRRGRHVTHEGEVEVRAPMPGKIVRLLVTAGAEVEANQAIAVMEAMKMQNEIRAPKRGIVRTMTVAEGTAVNANDLIATVE